MLPLFTHKQRAAEQGGRHRRKAGGCKKTLNGEHVWGDRQEFNYAESSIDEPLGYVFERCQVCRKKRYTWK